MRELRARAWRDIMEYGNERINKICECGSIYAISRKNAGKKTYCSSCWTKEKIKYNRVYREQNKEAIKVGNKQYYKNNKERIINNVMEYRINNADEVKLRQRRYRLRNLREIIVKGRVYYSENKEAISQRRMNATTAMSDRVLREYICRRLGIQRDKISSDLVMDKREQLTAKRLLLKFNKEASNG